MFLVCFMVIEDVNGDLQLELSCTCGGDGGSCFRSGDGRGNESYSSGLCLSVRD